MIKEKKRTLSPSCWPIRVDMPVIFFHHTPCTFWLTRKIWLSVVLSQYILKISEIKHQWKIYLSKGREGLRVFHWFSFWIALRFVICGSLTDCYVVLVWCIAEDRPVTNSFQYIRHTCFNRIVVLMFILPHLQFINMLIEMTTINMIY